MSRVFIAINDLASPDYSPTRAVALGERHSFPSWRSNALVRRCIPHEIDHPALVKLQRLTTANESGDKFPHSIESRKSEFADSTGYQFISVASSQCS
jgi:hypothetical protein